MKQETWLITVTMQVFAGDMNQADVISEAQRQLPKLLDGTDFSSVYVTDAVRDEM